MLTNEMVGQHSSSLAVVTGTAAINLLAVPQTLLMTDDCARAVAQCAALPS